MDSQAIEIIGRGRLIEQLLLGGVEVALPARDRGIDLIAYLDFGDNLSAFSACPIQMKASTERAFFNTSPMPPAPISGCPTARLI